MAEDDGKTGAAVGLTLIVIVAFIIFGIAMTVILSQIIGNRTNVPWLIVAVTFTPLFWLWIVLSVLGTDMGHLFGRPPKKLSTEIQKTRESTEL